MVSLSVLQAIKICRKSFLRKKRVGLRKGSALQDLMQEIDVMKRLSEHPHRNVIQLFEVIDDPHEDRIFLGMSCHC